MLGFAVLAGGTLALAIEERKWPIGMMTIMGLCFGPSQWAEVLATLGRTRPYGIMEWRAPRLSELV